VNRTRLTLASRLCVVIRWTPASISGNMVLTCRTAAIDDVDAATKDLQPQLAHAESKLLEERVRELGGIGYSR
jgi:hypothetical protein